MIRPINRIIKLGRLSSLSNLPRRPSKQFRSEPDDQQRDDLREIEDGGETSEREDREPVGRLSHPGVLKRLRDVLETVDDFGE